MIMRVEWKSNDPPKHCDGKEEKDCLDCDLYILEMCCGKIKGEVL